MPQNTKKPQLRFKGFTDDWEQRKLGEIGKATSGTSIESEFGQDGKYKVINIGSYSETSKYVDQGIRVNKTEKIINRILNKNDLTMILNDKTSKGNIIGRVLLIDKDDAYVYNQRTERIEVDKEYFEPTFIYQLLNADNIRKMIISSAQGNTQIYVNWSVIEKIEYYIPLSKDEQKSLASFLDNIDNLITLHQRKLEKLKNVKKSMLEKMFPKNGSNVPEIRFKGFTDAWEQRKLGDLCSEIGDGLHSAPIYDEKGSYFFINGNNLVNGKIIIDENETKKVSQNIFNDNNKNLDNTTLLLSINGTIGNLAYYQGEQVMLGKSAAYLKCKFVDKTYLYGVLQTNLILKSFMASLTGTTIKNLGLEVIKNTYIFSPKVNEQVKIGKYFHNLDNLITLHQRKLEKLQNIKKACLEKMFV